MDWSEADGCVCREHARCGRVTGGVVRATERLQTRGFNLPNKAHARFSNTVRTVLLAALTAGEASLPPCAT